MAHIYQPENDMQLDSGQSPVTIPPVPGSALTVPPVLGPTPGYTLPGQAPAVEWYPLPPTIQGCPPGLEYLTQLDQVLVHQQMERFESFTGFETANRYQIKNVLGQQMLFAYEESDLSTRLCQKYLRSFQMHIINNNYQEVLRVVRTYQDCTGCCCCADCCDHCAMTIVIEAPAGQAIGHVRQRGSLGKAHFDIFDANMVPILKIRGPCCPCQNACSTKDIDYKLMTHDESHEIGKISKQWSGIAQGWYTQADNFGIQFPKNLDVKVKATLLGAVFLIEFMIFERRREKPRAH